MSDGDGHHATHVLTLPTLEHGLKQLVQHSPPVELILENRSRFAVADPALIVRAFPKDFPRIQVNEYITSLRLRDGHPAGREITPSGVRPGTVLGFAEIESILHEGEALPPDAWLKIVTRQEKAKLPREGSPGLIREPRGLFLCPGLPADRIAGARVGGVEFQLLLDLGQLNAGSPRYTALRDAVHKAAESRLRHWQRSAALTRIAESKTDLPIVCAGGVPIVRETLAACLRARGFRRCSTLASPADGTFREPTLLLQTGPWEAQGTGAQVEEPHLVPLEGDLLPLLAPLDTLLPWRDLPYRPVPGDPPRLTPAALGEQMDELAMRTRKAQEGRSIADNRLLMLQQEQGVLGEAQAKLADLLEAGEALQVWSGSLPAGVKQVLVFSHDQEEAGAVLQALRGVPKKRWFDLSPFVDADALRSLSLEPVQHYLQAGMMVITAASRERLRGLQQQLVTARMETEHGLSEGAAAQRFYEEEQVKIAAAQDALARQWVRDAFDQWLDDHMPALLDRLEGLRGRHERRWFSRALVNRAVIVPSLAENRPALVRACGELFPGFHEEHSRVIHHTYEPLDALTTDAHHALRTNEDGMRLPEEAVREKVKETLRDRNEELFTAYLAGIVEDLEDARADLVLIEHPQETAFRILTHLRHALPALEETPVVVIVPDDWAPPPDGALPWPRTRVVSLPRLGALTQEDCVRYLRQLYAA